jgi:hypothetical protein
MASSGSSATERPSHRAALAIEQLDDLRNDEIVYVDRLGPRILRVPKSPMVRLSRDTLRALDKGRLFGHLARGTRFMASRMLRCPDITVDTDGQYIVQKQKDPNYGESPSFTVRTLNVLTGEPGELQTNRDIDDLIFYSVGEGFLPSYHSWQTDRLERRESSLELEKQNDVAERRLEFESSPKGIAQLIDEGNERIYSEMDEKASSDPENKLRHKPNILPDDPAWEGVEEYFKWILKEERTTNQRPRTLKVIEEELERSQALIAIPAMNSGYRAKIQDENTEKYRKALRTTFRGKPDNLATKLTMLCFGLPIEPLTLANVNFAGGPKDVPAKDGEDEPKGEIVERIEWSEKPLQFLDSYNERSYGYPMIRSELSQQSLQSALAESYSHVTGPKRKYEEIDAETVKKILARAKEPSKHPMREVCGFSAMASLAPAVHLRGGAGKPQNARPALGPKGKLLLYTDIGMFIMEDSFDEFIRLATRLLRLENMTFQCQLDVLMVTSTNLPNGELDESVVKGHVQSYQWVSASKYNLEYDKILKPLRASPDSYRLRVGVVSIQPEVKGAVDKNSVKLLPPLKGADALGPAVGSPPSLVLLEMRGVGTAYWYVPYNNSNGVSGVNEYQDPFRNAMECLIRNHRVYTVSWRLSKKPGSSGKIRLIAEAPSKGLYKAVVEAKQLASAAKDTGRIAILIEVIEDKEAKDSVKILMPGCNTVGWYRKPSEADPTTGSEVFKTIRGFVRRERPGEAPIRIWTGPQLYTDGKPSDKSMILPLNPDPDAEAEIWLNGLVWTEDAVVVRPECTALKIIDVSDVEVLANPSPNAKSLTWEREDSSFLLADLRRLLCQMFQTFEPTSNDCVSIEQPSTGYTFVIHPNMTELQWQFQVLDWLHPPNIHVRQSGHRICECSNLSGPRNLLTNSRL